MLSWATLEDAIQSWVATASGLTTIWAEQGAPRPDDSYIALSAIVRNVGQGWGTHEFDAGGDPGEELIETRYQVKELTLTLQCFEGGATGTTSPVAVLDHVMDSAELDAVRDGLSTAGWTPARKDPITKISGVIGGSVFEPRAIATCHGITSSELTGTATYIQIVEVENLINGTLLILDSEA
jgi:hypothetical protein